MKLCSTCGCPLKTTTHDRKWCPNCFEAEEEPEEESKEGEKSYIG